MRTSRLSARAAALACAAASVSTAAPSYADEAEWMGLNCGFTAASEPTGLVEQDPNVLTGLFWSGPWIAVDVVNDDWSGPSPEPGAAEMTKYCSIQINQADYGGFAVASCTATGTGASFSGCTISFTALPNDNVYYCTRVEMRHGDHIDVFIDDEDEDPSNGNQCHLAVATSDGRGGRTCEGVSHPHVVDIDH